MYDGFLYWVARLTVQNYIFNELLSDGDLSFNYYTSSASIACSLTLFNSSHRLAECLCITPLLLCAATTIKFNWFSLCIYFLLLLFFTGVGWANMTAGDGTSQSSSPKKKNNKKLRRRRASNPHWKKNDTSELKIPTNYGFIAADDLHGPTLKVAPWWEFERTQWAVETCCSWSCMCFLFD